VRRYYSGWQEQPGGTLGIGPYVHVSTTQSDLTKEIKHSTKNKKISGVVSELHATHKSRKLSNLGKCPRSPFPGLDGARDQIAARWGAANALTTGNYNCDAKRVSGCRYTARRLLVAVRGDEDVGGG
jgi:hypothetical protein